MSVYCMKRRDVYMEKIDSLSLGKKYLFVTSENIEYRGIFIDKDERYAYIKNVRHVGRFTSLYCMPISMIVRAS